MADLREQIKNLLALQDIDTHISVIQAEVEEAPRRVADLEARLKAKLERIESTQAEQSELEAKRTELEDKIKEANRKAKKSQARLSDVKNSRQHQAVLKELEDLELMKEEWTEALVGLTEELEEVNILGEDAAEGLDQLKANLEQERSQLDGSMEGMQAEIAELTKDRDKLAAKLQPAVLSRYNFIRSRLNDAAVAPVIDGTCQVCHMALPPQQFIELRRMEELMNCPSCQRIIYWVDYDA